MANERLRAAIHQAGLDPDELAARLQVDVKTVQRWIAGQTVPYTRHRARVAQALGRSEHELWPEVAAEPDQEDPRREVLGFWPQGNDLRAPDWRALMKDAVEQIDLLSLSLLDVVSAAGITDTLQAKAGAGCQIRVLIAAPDSVWVSGAARELGQDETDYVGHTELEREIELARGYLEPLVGREGIEVRQFYAERPNTILRFDQQMLVSFHLHGVPREHAPLLHLQRRGDGGLFDEFVGHLDAIVHHASQPLAPAPELYPDPRQHPDRYGPVTLQRYEEERRAGQQRSHDAIGASRPLEQVRDELRTSAEPAAPGHDG